MESIYIFGHKNPDTDSVCSSIALAYLKNELGKKAIPKVLGTINNETKFVLDCFKVEAPSYLNDVKVRIRNVRYNKKVYINEYASIKDAYDIMQKENTTAVPIVDDKHLLTGYVTLKELARFLISGNKEEIDTTLKNIRKTLNAEIITRFNEKIVGKIIVVGLQASSFFDEIKLNENDIIIVGDRYKILDYAIESKVKLIILAMDSNIDNKLIKKAEKNKVNIIRTHKTSYQIANQLILSNYIKSINVNHKPVIVHEDDYYTDFKQMSHKVNHTNYPIINKKGECLGLIRLTGPNTYHKQKVILVDHNNFAQSVDGIEEADIVEILDHHNLGAIGTILPINFRSRPVGCTATMIFDEFNNNKVVIPKQIAGLLVSAILSDTLLLTSPITTDDDRISVIKLAKIAKIDIEKYGKEMLKASSSIKGKSVEDLLYQDYKSYVVDDKKIGIGQVTTMDFDEYEKIIPEIIKELNNVSKNDYLLVAFFITDIIKKGSYVFYNEKAENLIKDSFGDYEIYEGKFLKGVISRKKQVLPAILNTVERGN